MSKRPLPTRKGSYQMNEQRPPKTETVFSDIATVDTDDRSTYHEKHPDLAPVPQPPHSEPEGGEFVIIEDAVRLSPDQRRVSHELSRLYQSLCGNQPGQYWPQALLDSAGKFNRAVFPRRGRR